MGSTQSVQAVAQVSEEEEEEEDEEDECEDNGEPATRELDNFLVKKVLEQEPEMLPCHASASPLSPQLSSLGTPRLGPSIKVWDPYNVLAPPPPPPHPVFSRTFSSNVIDEDRVVTEVFLISHGECELSLRPDLVGGRCPGAALTPKGKHQARALAVLLHSQGVRFSAVYSSPLDRALSMAVSVCQEMNVAEEHIQSSDAVIEMNHGLWEGCARSEIYTPETVAFIDRIQPDFSAPSGESLRQVEFRMVHFLNTVVLELPGKLTSVFSSHHQNENHDLSHQASQSLSKSIHDQDGSHRWDLLHRQRHGMTRKKSGKSRLQFVTNTGEHDPDDEISPQEASHQSSSHDDDLTTLSGSRVSSCVGVFTHALPIKCLLTGVLGCSTLMLNKLCIEDSSVTVLQHSLKTGWQIKRLNDTAHLRLL